VTPLRAATDAERFGGKASQLAQALAADLPVPDGAALDWEAVERVASGGAIEPAALGNVGTGDRFAVRSSAIGEDGARASFAGQHASLLHVRLGELADAVRKVRQSAHEPGALAYRRRLGVDSPPRMAVVVQRMVPADVAGVLFTKNPVSGASELLIEASWGLGQAVVAGLVTPDRYRLSAAGELLERELGAKDARIDAAAGSGTVQRETSADELAAFCLDNGMLGALHALVGRIDRAFSGPHDVEFAFSQGQLFLLQRRAITR